MKRVNDIDSMNKMPLVFKNIIILAITDEDKEYEFQ